MADALPGAVAPSFLAALAKHHTPQRQHGAVPDPLALLRLLDGWMAAAGHGDDHPWRLSIAQTVSAAKGERASVPEPVAVAVLDIAQRLSALLALIDSTEGPLPSTAVRAMVAHSGYMADLVLQLCDGGPLKGGAAAWLLRTDDAAELAALGVQA